MRLHEYYFENLREKAPLDNTLSKRLYDGWEQDFKATGTMRSISWAIPYQNLDFPYCLRHHLFAGHAAKPDLLPAGYSTTPSTTSSAISSSDMPRTSFRTYSLCSPSKGLRRISQVYFDSKKAGLGGWYFPISGWSTSG